MKIRVDGKFKGESAFLEWEDGQVSGSGQPVIERVFAEAEINVSDGFPTPDGFKGLDDWMSHPRGFVLCARAALEDASTDWVDHEMDGVVLMR